MQVIKTVWGFDQVEGASGLVFVLLGIGWPLIVLLAALRGHMTTALIVILKSIALIVNVGLAIYGKSEV